VTVGTHIRVTGARDFDGVILALTDTIMVVAVSLDQSIYLRRDPASTTPLAWRYGGLPVTVTARQLPIHPADFGDRLARLMKRRPQ